jgi:hypothetical protein
MIESLQPVIVAKLSEPLFSSSDEQSPGLIWTEAVEAFWQLHPSGDQQLGGLTQAFAGDCRQFFRGYDEFRREPHILRALTGSSGPANGCWKSGSVRAPMLNN